MTEKVYLPFYFEWAEIIEELSDVEYGQLMKAVMAYAMGKCEIEDMSSGVRMAYKFITASIKRSEENRKNGSKGGQKRVENERQEAVSVTDGEYSYASGSGELSDGSYDDSGELSDGARETDGSKTACTEAREPDGASTAAHCVRQAKERCESKGRGVPSPPTLGEVRDFFKKNGFSSLPDDFFNYYDSIGWRVGKNSMRNWQAAAKKWESREKKERGEGEKTKPRYGDFDIDGAFAAALSRTYSDA